MFTSRSEYRLALREDNADLRLTPIARELGLISDANWRMFEEKQEAIEQEKQRLRTLIIRPNTPVAKQLESFLSQPLEKEVRALDLLRRPEVNYEILTQIEDMGWDPKRVDRVVAEQIEVQLKYAGYIDAQEKEIARTEKYGSLRLPTSFDYSQISGLSNELQEKLTRVQPETLSQAARIPGITPAAISLLLVYLKSGKAGEVEENKHAEVAAH